MNRWIVCLAGTGINLVLGVLYSWSIFVVPLQEKFGWSRADLTWPFSVSILTFALVMIAAGKWQDRVGPRPVATVGGILMGLGYILSGFVTSLTALIFTFGVIAGAGVACGYVTPIAATVKWFPDKRGLATGITVSGFGFGAFVFTPLARKLIVKVGVMTAFKILGVIFLTIVVILAQFLRDPPPGWKPEGWEPPAPSETKTVATTRDWTLGEAIKTWSFWSLWLAFLGNAGVGLMVISLIAPLAKSLGISQETAAFLIGFLSIFNGLGRILAGWISDIIGRKSAMLLFFSITTIMCIVMAFTNFAGTTIGYALALMIFGASYGANFALFPAATADYFGTKNLGNIYAGVFTAWGFAGFVGPRFIKARMLKTIPKKLIAQGMDPEKARLMAYKAAFKLAIGLGVLAVVMALLTRPPKEE